MLSISTSAKSDAAARKALLAAPRILRPSSMPPRRRGGAEHIAVDCYFEVWRRAMALFDDGFPLRVASFSDTRTTRSSAFSISRSARKGPRVAHRMLPHIKAWLRAARRLPGGARPSERAADADA